MYESVVCRSCLRFHHPYPYLNTPHMHMAVCVLSSLILWTFGSFCCVAQPLFYLFGLGFVFCVFDYLLEDRWGFLQLEGSVSSLCLLL